MVLRCPRIHRKPRLVAGAVLIRRQAGPHGTVESKQVQGSQSNMGNTPTTAN
jgi:hypothetical protein